MQSTLYVQENLPAARFGLNKWFAHRVLEKIKVVYFDVLHFKNRLLSGLKRHSKMLYNPLIHYIFYRSQSLVPVQSQMTRIHNLKNCFSEIYFSIIPTINCLLSTSVNTRRFVIPIKLWLLLSDINLRFLFLTDWYSSSYTNSGQDISVLY
jgi:hypothetical protein